MSGPLFGAVLAGGASSRFGSDKARAEVGGRPMAVRALDALRPWVAGTGLVLAADSPEGVGTWGCPVRRDRRPGLGPLEGLRVALEWGREEGCEGVVVLACDLPLVDGAVVGALVRAWRGRDADAFDAVVPVVDGRLQPLAAVYATAALGVAARRVEGSARSVTGMLEELRVREVPTGSPDLPTERFLNVNRPADARRVRAILDRGAAGPGHPGGGR